MSHRLPESVNYYALLAHDDALHPVADNAKLRSLITDAIKTRGAASARAQARHALLESYGKQMLDDLGPVPQATATPSPNSIWLEHHAKYQAILRARSTDCRARTKTVFDMLGEKEFKPKVVKKIERVLEDSVIVQEVMKARNIRVSNDLDNSTVSTSFVTACGTARTKVTNLLPYLESFGVSDIYALLSKVSGETVSARSDETAFENAITRLRRIQQDVGNQKKTRALNQIETLLSDLFKKNGPNSSKESPRGIVDDLIKIERELPFFATVQILKDVDMVRRDHLDRLVTMSYARSGLPPQRVLQLTKALMQKDKVAIYDWGLTENFRICAACGAINNGSQKECTACKGDLFITCVNCAKQYDGSFGTCPHCKTTTATGTAGHSATNKAERALSAGNLDLAESQIREASRLVPLSSTVTSLTAKVKAMQNIAFTEQQHLSSLVKQHRRMVEALGGLSKPAAGIPQQVVEELRQLAQSALKEASGLTTRARFLADKGEHAQAEELALKALSKVTDQKEAQEILDASPPQPPIALRITVSDEAVHLRWTAPPTGIGKPDFAVVRSTVSTPTSPRDGTRVSTVSETSFSDMSSPIGVRLHYAVFSVRGNLHSLDAATRSSIFRLAPVKDLKIQPHDTAVRLAWELPPDAHTAEIYRTKPADSFTVVEGSKPLAYEKSNWIDVTAQPGQKYSYHVLACYRAPDGTLMRSNARSRLGGRTMAPSAIRAIKQDMSLGRIIWNPAPGPSEEDEVLVVGLGKPLPEEGALVEESKLASELRLPTFPNSTGFDTSQLPFGAHQVLILRKRDGLAFVGPSINLTNLPVLRDLSISPIEGGAEIRWRWPDGCEMAKLRISENSATHDKTVRRTAGKPTGHYKLAPALPAHVDVAAFAVQVKGPGESEPVCVSIDLLEQNRLTFNVTTKKSLLLGRGTKKVKLHAELEAQEHFPPFEIRFHADYKPENDEGESVQTFPKGDALIRKVEIDLTFKLHGRRGFLNLVLLNPKDRDRVSVIPLHHEIT